MEENLELLVATGPLAGSRFAVPPGGLRLGRSGSCEISIKDPALSRNHLLVERRDDGVWATDLASANGTSVNGAELGADAVRLAAGDVIVAGESELRVVREGEDPNAEPPKDEDADFATPSGAQAEAPIDLGFGKDAEPPPAEARNWGRVALWAAAIAAVAVAAVTIVGVPDSAISSLVGRSVPEAKIHSLFFESVKASADGIFRYELTLDSAGKLAVRIDDLPDGGRNLEKSKTLDKDAMKSLGEIFADKSFGELVSDYVGQAAGPCDLKRCRLRLVRGTGVKEVLVENAAEPEPFRDVRTKLETFSQHELGIVGIQLPREELIKKSEDAIRAADEKFDARDVEYGNVAAAVAGYEDAVYYLETVNPKPDGYEKLRERLDAAKQELDRRWKDRYFLVDKAIHQEDWDAARRELTVLCALVPNERDPRHEEARKKLLDVEARAKKGGKK